MDEILDTLVKLNPWWDFQKFDIGIFRNKYTLKIKKYLSTGEIVVLSGVRRAGKTTLIYQMIHDLINDQDTEPKKILFVNCDEPILNLSDNFLKKVIDVYKQNVCSEDHTYLIFDEIQNVTGWEKWIKSLYDTKKYHIIISGSSSHLLDSSLSHLISGRYFRINVFPLDFMEYLQFNDFHIKKDRISAAANKDRIIHMMKKYLQDGGFPRVTLEKDRELKREYLKSYYDSIVYKDIILLHKIRNVKILRELITYMCSNITNLYSYKKMAELLKIDYATLKEYFYYAQEAKILFEMHYFSYSLKTQSRNNKKIYCIDNGLRNAVSFRFSKDEGRLAENLVFVELLRMEKEPYYWIGKSEVDFVLKNKDGSLSAINVSYTNEIDKRENLGLIEFQKNFAGMIKELIVLTKDVNKTENGVRFIPMWKWMLGIEN
ncbi:MAG: ATP-binding protein [Methanosarcinales archaeon]|nr:ATP-binding protein [Methanosarcinales archaeon]